VTAGWQVPYRRERRVTNEPAATPFGAGLTTRRGDGLLGLAALFDIRLGLRDEGWTLAIVEQAWSGVGMDELRVLASGAWDRLTWVLIANRGQAGFRHGPPKWVMCALEVSAIRGSRFLGQRAYLASVIRTDTQGQVTCDAESGRVETHEDDPLLLCDPSRLHHRGFPRRGGRLSHSLA
jgi:hypothetical protein